jgi:hypothetical protein
MPLERSTPWGDVMVAAGEPHEAISWAAIFAGAVASLAMSLVLSTLVAGFGFQLVSPWPGASSPPGAFTPMLGAGMIAVQVMSSALGGYLAGRLRTKWLNVHSHEAHFRDTAHGLLAWAVSTLMGAVLVATLLAAPAGGRPGPGDPAAMEATAMTVVNQNATHVAAQISFFLGFGLLLSAFTAAVAAALGGLRREEMCARYWDEEHTASRPPVR